MQEEKAKRQHCRKILPIFLIFGCILLFIAYGLNARSATPPDIITYQGKLLVNGSAATTSQDMYFILYDSASGGTVLYTAGGTIGTPTSISVTPTSGLFSINLGDTGTNAMDPNIFKNNSSIYLEVRIGSDTLTPRKQITASPYSFNSKYLDGVAPATVSSSTYIPVSDVNGNFNFNSTTISTTTITNKLAVISSNTSTFNWDVIFSRSIQLAITTDTNTGVIYKGSSPFIHDYKDEISDGHNIFIGLDAGNFTMAPDAGNSWEASDNVGIGYNVLNTNTMGNGNVGIGTAALDANTRGSYNVAVGRYSLSANITGDSNVAVGDNALSSNQNGQDNAAFGSVALASNVSGLGNVAVGASSLHRSTGSYNTGVGYNAGVNTTGQGNTIIGTYAGWTLDNGNHNILIGYSVYTPATNSSGTLNIGNLIFGTNINGEGTTISSGNIGIGTTSPAWKLSVAGDINTTGTIRINNYDYGQYFISTSGYSGNVWTSAGSGRGYWGTAGVVTETDPIFSLYPAIATSTFLQISASTSLPNLYSVGTITSGNWSSGSVSTTNLYASGTINFAGGLIFTTVTGTIGSSVSSTNIYSPNYTGIWNGSKISIIGGGTNSSTIASNGSVIYSDGSMYNATAVGITGQLLQSNGAGAPTWINTSTIGIPGVGIVGQIPYYATDGFVLSATSALFIAANGNVGANSTTPTYPLSVFGNVGIDNNGAIYMNDTNVSQYFITSTGNNGQLWMSDGSGAGQWANTSSLGFASSSGSNSYIQNQSSVDQIASFRISATGTLGALGVNTTSPLAKFTIVDGAILAEGTTGATPISGPGTRMMWIPSKAAFRAGAVTSIAWDDARIGMYSAVFGIDNEALGTGSAVFGSENYVTSTDAFAAGSGNTVRGDFSVAFGNSNTIVGGYSMAVGSSNQISAGAYNGYALGNANIITGNVVSGGWALGLNNTLNGDSSYAFGSKITVNGSSSIGFNLDTSTSTVINQSHVLAIMNGNVGIGTTTPQAALTILDGAILAVSSTSGTGAQGTPISGPGTRMMWIPSKAAFRSGAVGVDTYGADPYGGTEWDDANIGQYSVALGVNNKASALGSVALGMNNFAGGPLSVAMGFGSYATGTSATALGDSSATGDGSLAFGAATASGTASIAIGGAANALVQFAVAIGTSVTSTAQYSIAMGRNIAVSGLQSFGIGLSNQDNGVISSNNTFGIVNGSIMASGTIGNTPGSGPGTRMMWIPSKAAFRAGYASSTEWEPTSIGDYSVAFGYNVEASGPYTFASGVNVTSTGIFSMAMGASNISTGTASFAVGSGNKAQGDSTIAMGNNAIASAAKAIAIGETVRALASRSVAIGEFVTSSGGNSFVMGKYLTVSGQNSFGIGLGSTDNGVLTSDNTFGIINGAIIASGTNGNTPVSGPGTRMMWVPSKAAFRAGKLEDQGGEEPIFWDDAKIGSSSVAMGWNVIASNTTAVAIGSFAEATGARSVALGSSVIASGDDSVALGFASRATGASSFAVGYQSYASGTLGIAIGDDVIASGAYSTAMGTRINVTGGRSFGISLNDIWPRYELNQSNVMAIMGGNVGIGTTTPQALFTLQGGAILAAGTVGATPASGPGTRMMWIPSKSAFRAGYVAGAQWNDANIGNYSTALGQSNIANGSNAFAGGLNSIASGTAAFAFGDNVISGAYNSVGMGRYVYSNAVAGNSFAFGEYVTSTGNTSFAFGQNVAATTNNTFVFGVGVSASQPLTNSIQNSMMFGINSVTPTLFLNNNFNVGIATTSFPGGTSDYRLKVDAGGPTGAGIGVDGFIKATGLITQSSALDLAENYPIDPSCVASGTCPSSADAVCLVKDSPSLQIEKCSAKYDENIVGIISTNPGFLLEGGLDETNSRRVALAGRVPVKVSTANGMIHVGDKLTSSDISGVVIKATVYGPTVGIAMEDYTDPGVGTVTAFVNVGWNNEPNQITLGSSPFIFNAINNTSTNNYIVSLRSNNDPVFSVSANGDVNTKGNIYAPSIILGTSTNPGDLAEKVDIAIDDNVESGDVLMVDPSAPDTYRRSNGAYEQSVAGVVSTNPTIIVGNGKTDYTAVMAMVGRVPVKVSNENGPIQRGDLLVSASMPGYAMKYDPAKDNNNKLVGIIGVALEPTDQPTGKIMTLIRTGWMYNRDNTIAEIQNSINQIASLQGINLSPSSSPENLGVSQTGGQLTYTGGNLDLQNNTIINVASITGAGGKWRIDADGNLIAKVQTANGSQDLYAMQSTNSELVFSSSSQLMAGTAQIDFDSAIKDVIDPNQPLKISVTLTSGEGNGVYVASKSATGFVVKELNNGNSNATFDWIVVAKRSNTPSTPVIEPPPTPTPTETPTPTTPTPTPETVTETPSSSPPVVESVPAPTVPEVPPAPETPPETPPTPPFEVIPVSL